MSEQLPPLQERRAEWANVVLFALQHPLQTLVLGIVALVVGYSAHAIRDSYLHFDAACSSSTSIKP